MALGSSSAGKRHTPIFDMDLEKIGSYYVPDAGHKLPKGVDYFPNNSAKREGGARFVSTMTEFKKTFSQSVGLKISGVKAPYSFSANTTYSEFKQTTQTKSSFFAYANTRMTIYVLQL